MRYSGSLSVGLGRAARGLGRVAHGLGVLGASGVALFGSYAVLWPERPLDAAAAIYSVATVGMAAFIAYNLGAAAGSALAKAAAALPAPRVAPPVS